MLKKGDIVKVKARTMGLRKGSLRELHTAPYSKPRKGIVLGYSFIRTGYVESGNKNPYDYEPGYLSDITDNKVWIIELFDKRDRYIEPIRALEENIDVIRQ